jgi:hypothetical protein
MSVIYNIDIFAELPFCRPFIGPAQGSSEIKSMTHFSEYSLRVPPARIVQKNAACNQAPGHLGKMLIKSLKNKHLPHGNLKGFHIFTGCFFKV